MDKTAKFNIGDLVMHKRSLYRAVIVDIDPLFQASGHYNPQVPKRDFATRSPWYRLLVDDSSQMTYVEETMLVADLSQQPINNPQVYNYFGKQEGQYQFANTKH